MSMEQLLYEVIYKGELLGTVPAAERYNLLKEKLTGQCLKEADPKDIEFKLIYKSSIQICS